MVASPRSGAVDPLIEEARRRARRRRLRNTGAAVAVVAASAGYVGFDRAGGPAETTATGHPDLVANGALTILRATPSSTAISAVGTGGALRVLAVCDHNRHVGNWCNEPVSLAWAPDGQRVAVSAAFEGGAYQVSGVHLIDVRSGRDVQIPRAPVIHFADAGPGRDLFFPSARSVVPSEDAWLKRVVRRVGCFWPAELAWSPDGTTLAYRCGFPRFSGLNVLRVAGGRHRVIPDARHAFWPTWSPDGTRIAYSTTLRPRPGSRIVGVAPDGSHRTAMVRGGAAPAWSPDGRTIAYQSACGVRLVTPAGRDVTPGRATGTCGIGPTGRPVWSPDGRLIAVGAATGMYVMQVDGSGLHRLTGRTGNSFYGAEPGRPSWQPKPQPR